MTIDGMAVFMRDEIANGMDETDVMPGHIKIAIEDKFLADEVKALRAGARVANETGYAMTVHQGMLIPRERF